MWKLIFIQSSSFKGGKYSLKIHTTIQPSLCEKKKKKNPEKKQTRNRMLTPTNAQVPFDTATLRENRDHDQGM